MLQLFCTCTLNRGTEQSRFSRRWHAVVECLAIYLGWQLACETQRQPRSLACSGAKELEDVLYASCLFLVAAQVAAFIPKVQPAPEVETSLLIMVELHTCRCSCTLRCQSNSDEALSFTHFFLRCVSCSLLVWTLKHVAVFL